ncbi:MAG TPA: hypothetical protein PKI19_03495 [Elusimicrobiales bacterium]|mgnify:CR=1 FL=1|nr:hypothetical protein [Elusimicrobiales bacterium]
MRKVFLSAAVLLSFAPLGAQQQPAGNAAWKYFQELKTAAPGVYKHKLPLEVIDGAQPGLADLRIMDAAGKEVPYLLETARYAQAKPVRLAGFKSKLEGLKTELTARAETAGYVDSVVLESPAASFIKPADFFVSMDGKQWTKVAEGLPLFRQYCNSENLRADLAPVLAKYIKVIVDDARAAPVPFTGLKAALRPRLPAALETLPAAIITKEDYASTSRVAARLPARNLFVFAVEVGVSDKLFSRGVTVSGRYLEDGGMVSKQQASDLIFATDAAGSPAGRSRVLVYSQFQNTSEIVLDVDNGNSPPLDIRSVKVVYAPVSVVFQSKAAGAYRLLFGNKQAAARAYDLPGIASYLKGKNISAPDAGKVEANPAFAEAEALTNLEVFGGSIDTEKWLYRIPVSAGHAGVQGLELDSGVISLAARDLRDVRLVSGLRQVPYILDRDYAMRSLAVTAESGPAAPPLSTWRLKLPYKNFPLRELTAQAPDTVFQRRVSLYETAADERGRAFRRMLGSAVWSNTGLNMNQSYSVSAAGLPSGDELELEVEDGDNKPLELSGFKLYYPVSRLIFKWKGGGALWLYYGNRAARAPDHDISLVAAELLQGEKQAARLEGKGAEAQGWGNFKLFTTFSRAAFWAVLAAVAALLVFLIFRLLPPPPADH